MDCGSCLAAGADDDGDARHQLQVLFDYLYQLLRGENYLVVLDGFEKVAEEPLVTQVADRLRQEVLAGEFRLILTTQRMPDFIQTLQVQPLGGMTPSDTQALLLAKVCNSPQSMLRYCINAPRVTPNC